MQASGRVIVLTESVLGTFTAVDDDTFTTVELNVGGLVMIKFPLALETTPDEIGVRLGNVCNQTGLVTPPVNVVLDP